MKTAHAPTPKYTVRKQGRQWAVYRGDELIEGGFFRREYAEREAYERNAYVDPAGADDGETTMYERMVLERP